MSDSSKSARGAERPRRDRQAGELTCTERLDRARAYVLLMRELRERAADGSPRPPADPRAIVRALEEAGVEFAQLRAQPDPGLPPA